MNKVNEKEREIKNLQKIEMKQSDIFWTDEKVIDFVNWYIKLNKMDFRYTLENKTILESFKNGDDVSIW